ncbi:ROK family transcriptional regulator [Pedococcus bigeumensis]|uniref:ROK family transcriptional regulator n=1 Tax=Pedococcus bigeumensis TaxID=433644 RepID=UPI0019D5E6C7|nr:ROK family transcriptional regulator [Pedococcus bigeumensis]
MSLEGSALGRVGSRSPRPATPSLLRALNDRAALDLLLAHGSLSRSQIGRLTGLSKPTASQLLDRLERAGLVESIGPSEGGLGRKSVLYQVNPTAGYAAALDVTPSRIEAAIADLTGAIIGRHVLATPRGTHHPQANVLACLEGALGQTGLTVRDLDAVVIGAPGSIDPATEQLRYAKHLTGWHQPGILTSLAEAIGTDIRVENDVNLAATAEHRAGAAAGCEDFFLFWADEGLGGALMLGGQLYRGATGGAGEIGFMQGSGEDLVRRVRRENSGGFQRYAGPAQIVPLARRFGLAGKTAAAVVAAAVKADVEGGPTRGGEFLDELATRFAGGLASIIAVIDPAMVVLSGGTAAAGGEALRGRIQAQLRDLAMAHPDVVLSTVPDNPVLAGGLGSALELAREAIFTTG